MNRRPTLRFREDGTFTIAMFGDLHLKDHGEDVLPLLDDVVRLDDPDLLVINGDAVHRRTEAEYWSVWRALIGHIEGFGLPWMYVFGNHEYGAEACDGIERLLLEAPHCLYEHGPVPAPIYGNCVAPILSASGNDEIARVVALNLGINDDDRSHFPPVREHLLQWLASAVTGPNGRPNTLAFLHFPLRQFEDAWKNSPCHGYKTMKVGWQIGDEGVFRLLTEHAEGLFVSHDHGNDFESTLEGLRMCYGRCSSPRGTKELRTGFPPGARVITLRDDHGGFASHVRLADGSLAARPTHEPEEE